MTILVTGGAGFIGSHVAEALLKGGKEVAVIDDFDGYYTKEVKQSNLSLLKRLGLEKFYEVNIINKNYIEKIFASNSIEAVIHLAAKAGVRASIQNPLDYVNTNVLGTATLLEAARKHGVKKFVFGSSSSVYGISKPPFKESDSTDSQLSPYGATKKAAEVLCSAYSSLYGLPIIALRFFTVYGPRGRPDMAILKFIRLIESGQPIVLYGNGNVTRGFTFVLDIVSGITASLEAKVDSFEAINLGSDKPVEISKIADLLQKELCIKAQIKFEDRPRVDLEATAANLTKAKRLLHWEPKVPIEEGVKKTVAWWNTEGRLLYSDTP